MIDGMNGSNQDTPMEGITPKTPAAHMRPADVAVMLGILAALLLLVFAAIFGWQWFKVFSAEQSGKAELARAEWNRQIQVREAQALLDAATLTAQAEVIRAEGVAEANRIVANGLGGPEGYLRYLYIDMLRTADGTQTIYIPTEAGLPILEAGRR